MSCLSVLECSLFVDHELGETELRNAQQHLSTCATCHARVDYLQNEVLAVRHALHHSSVHQSVHAPVAPLLVTRPTLSRSVSWLVGTALFVWATVLAWASVSQQFSPPQWLRWPFPSSTGVGIDLVLELFGPSGEWLLQLVSQTGEALLLLLALGGVWLLLPRRKITPPNACLGIALCALLTTFATDSYAFELRHDELSVEVATDETINDTLIAGAERVDINGNVNGDLIVVGERVRIRGTVTGSIFGAAEELIIEGSVGGTIVAAGETIETRQANISGNIFSAGESVSVRAETRVSGNALLFGEELSVEGTIDRDLVSTGEQVMLSGSVGGDMRAYGESALLNQGASVGGNLTGVLETPDNLRVSADASVSGTTNSRGWPEKEEHDAWWEGIVATALKIAAAMLCGLLLFLLFPSLRRRELFSTGEYFGTAALGGVAMIGVPVVAVIIAFTLIGAPIGIAGFLLWIMGLYLSGIVAANYLGNMLLDHEGHGWIKPLLLGVVLLIIAIQIPVLGDVVRIVAMVLGFGLIGQWLRDQWQLRAI